MKVVLRHQTTGRYYAAAGHWVRRADNALAFDDSVAAEAYVQTHQIPGTRPVYRLAPYLITLLNQHPEGRRTEPGAGESNAPAAPWPFACAHKFAQN